MPPPIPQAYHTAYKDDKDNQDYILTVDELTKQLARQQKSEQTSEIREKAKEQFGKEDYKGPPYSALRACRGLWPTVPTALPVTGCQ